MTIRRALEPANYPFFDYRRFSFSLGVAAAGRIWLSGSTAVRFEPPDGMVVKGDLVAQAAVIFEKMTATLTAAKRSLADVVRMVRYVTPNALPDLPLLDVYERKILGDRVSAVTVPVKSLLRPEALIEIEAVVSDGESDGLDYLPSITAPDRAGAWAKVTRELDARGLDRTQVMKVTELATRSIFESPAPNGAIPSLYIEVPCLSHADAGVQIDITIAPRRLPVVFMSAEADPSKDGIVNQCRDLYARLGAELAQAGACLGSVVKTTEFVTPAALRDYRGTAELRREVFAPPYPAATGVVCDRLRETGALIAVEATALTEAG